MTPRLRYSLPWRERMSRTALRCISQKVFKLFFPPLEGGKEGGGLL